MVIVSEILNENVRLNIEPKSQAKKERKFRISTINYFLVLFHIFQ